MNDEARRSGSWWPVLALVALVALQLGLYRGVFHRSRSELELLFAEGTPEQRAWALHVLTNRGEIDPDDYDAAFMRTLLADEDLLVREMAFTNDVCKMRPPELQKEYLAEYVEADIHFLRSFVLFRRKVGGWITGSGLKLARKELEWLFMVEDGILPPQEEMQEHFAERQFQAGVRKGLIDPETGEPIDTEDDPSHEEF